MRAGRPNRLRELAAALRGRIFGFTGHNGAVKTVALIVPSQTYRADAYLNAANKLDIEVVTVSDTGQAMSKVMGDHFLQVALDDPITAADELVALSGRLHLDAIVAVDDGGALCAAYAGKKLGLVHNDPKAVEATRNKSVMRRLVSVTDVTQPKYRIIEHADGETIGDHVSEAGTEIGYPVVIKPAGLSASRGVIRANDSDAALAAGMWSFSIARGAHPTGDITLLVESFVVGEEVAFEGHLSNGHLEFLAIFDKPDPLNGPFFEETIYVRPSKLAATTQERITELAGMACAAMGVTEGPVHAEFRITPPVGDEEPVITFIELAARTIGGRCAKALSFNDGMSIEEIVLSDALRVDSGPITPDEGATGVLMLPIRQAGRLLEIANQKEAAEVEGIAGVEITVAPGRVLRPFPESDRYLGFVFASANSPEEVVAALRLADHILEVRVDVDDLDDKIVRR